MTQISSSSQKFKFDNKSSVIDVTKSGLSPQYFYITDRSKAILMLCFYLSYILGRFLCCLNLVYVFIVLVQFE